MKTVEKLSEKKDQVVTLKNSRKHIIEPENLVKLLFFLAC